MKLQLFHSTYRQFSSILMRLSFLSNHLKIIQLEFLYAITLNWIGLSSVHTQKVQIEKHDDPMKIT